MKSKKNLLEQLKSLPHFSKESLYQLGKPLGLANSSLDTYISRFLKNKEIIQLKKGLYISTDFFNKNRADISYSFYLANILRTPSYISSWTALQYYNLSTDVIHGVTSITSKVTRDYQTKAGTFSYQSIKEDLFSNFSLIKGETGRFDFLVASPAKALFDLLYFKTHQYRGIPSKEIPMLIEELRIDIDEMNKTERSKFYTLIKDFYHE